jgi:hypothetical protein
MSVFPLVSKAAAAAASIVVKPFGAAFAGLENKSDGATKDIRIITRSVFFMMELISVATFEKGSALCRALVSDTTR